MGNHYCTAAFPVRLPHNFNSEWRDDSGKVYWTRYPWRPDARGFAEYIASQSSVSAILEPDGNPMEQMIEPERKRVDSTGARIIRGLYFIEMKRPLPEHAILRVASKAGLTADHPDMLTIARAWSSVTDHRTRSVGMAFSYSAAVGEGVSFWLLLLYDYFFWGGNDR